MPAALDSGLRRNDTLAAEIFVEVTPVRIHTLDQLDFQGDGARLQMRQQVLGKARSETRFLPVGIQFTDGCDVLLPNGKEALSMSIGQWRTRRSRLTDPRRIPSMTVTVVSRPRVAPTEKV